MVAGMIIYPLLPHFLTFKVVNQTFSVRQNIFILFADLTGDPSRPLKTLNVVIFETKEKER